MKSNIGVVSPGFRLEARQEEESWERYGDDEQRNMRVERRGNNSTNFWDTTLAAVGGSAVVGMAAGQRLCAIQLLGDQHLDQRVRQGQRR